MSSRVRERLRAVADRLPPRVRRGLVRAIRQAQAGRPQVSAVVLLTGPEGHARATLEAVRAQPEATLEILPVVMDPRLRPLADAAAEEDWRVRPAVVADHLAHDWAHARELGSAAARTPWLLFLSPRQLLLPGAVETLMAARGAAPAVVLGELEGAAEPWSRTPLLGRLLVPHELWARTVDDGEPDGQTAAVSLLVEGFSEAGTPTLRDDASSRARLFERVANPMPALTARVSADRSMLTDLEGDADLRRARAAGALDRDLPRFLLAVERCDEAEWDLLRAHTAELAGAAGETALLSTPVEDRTAAWLAAEGRREALTEFVAARRYAGGGFATSTKDGVVLAQLDGAPGDVPASVLRLDEAESSLRAQVRRMRREDDDLVLEIFAGLRKVDQGGDFPEVGARLLGSGEPVDLPVEVHPDAAVTRWMGEPHQYHDYGVLTVRIPLRALSTGSWQVELDMQHSGVRRTGRVTELEGHGSAARTLSVGDRALRWVATPEGVQLVVTDEQPPAPHGAVVRRFESAPGRLLLEVDAPAGATTALIAPGQTVPGTPDGSQCRLRADHRPLEARPGAGPDGRLPALRHRRRDRAAGDPLGRRVRPAAVHRDRRAASQSPVARAPGWGGAPARPSAGRRGVRALRPSSGCGARRTAPRARTPRPGLFYFQAFAGEASTEQPPGRSTRSCTGNRATRPPAPGLGCRGPLPVCFPTGAEAVVVGSRAHYDALARASWVVTNNDLESWFVRRPGAAMCARPTTATRPRRWGWRPVAGEGG